MPYEKADNQTYESREEATGREYLFRKVCGKAPLPAREGWAFTTGISRCSGNQPERSLSLGIRHSCPQSCQSTRCCESLESQKDKRLASQRINIFYILSDAPLDDCRTFCRISPVNLMGGISRIAKPASARPVKLTLNRQKQSGF